MYKALFEIINYVHGQRMTFGELIFEIGKMGLFITDFVRFLKCLRNRLFRRSVFLHVDLLPVVAEHLKYVLPTGDALESRSNGSQLKDLIAPRVFTLHNLVTLLINDMIHEAFYFLPIVFWRVTNQGLNITRNTGLIFLETVFDSARRCAHWFDGCGLSDNCPPGELTFFWRFAGIKKLIVSHVVLGFVPSVLILRIAINCVGTIDL
jgi:hypothetical protein